MTFAKLLTHVLELLRRQGQLSYRALKVRFQLDNDLLEALKDERIYAQRVAADEDSRVLVWIGEPAFAPAAAPAPTGIQEQQPLAYTPQHLTEKILASRTSLEGERKQVTVLFADIKDSTELIRDLDPEAAQQLLDPAIHRMMDAVHRQTVSP
jgi:hypothetical protein